MMIRRFSRSAIALLLTGAAALSLVAIGMVIRPHLFGPDAPTVQAHSGQQEFFQTTVRIAATRLADGRTSVSLQQYDPESGWGAAQRPRFRVIPLELEAGESRFSSELELSVAGPPPSPWTDQRGLIYQQAFGVGQFAGQFVPSLASGEGTIACVRIEGDEDGITTCDAVRAGYSGPVEEIVVPEAGQVRDHLEALYTSDDLPAMVQLSSVSMMLNAIDVRASVPGVDPNHPVSAPFIFHQRALDHDSLHCVAGHGQDTFWGVLRASAIAAAERSGLNYDIQLFNSADEQAAFIRECAERGAVGIASSIADPEQIVPALQEARAAGATVISYNSGAEFAQEAGSDLHIAMDDSAAGVLVGERLDEDGVSGTVLCLVHEQANVGLEQRCDGLAEGYSGEVETVNLTQVESIAAAASPRDRLIATGTWLAQQMADSEVGAIVALNAETGGIALGAKRQTGAQTTVVSFGIDHTFIQGLYSGLLSFIVFDHPVAQGYLAVAGLSLADGLIGLSSIFLGGVNTQLAPVIIDADDLRRAIVGPSAN